MGKEFGWDEASKPAETFSFEDAAKPVAPPPAGPVDGQKIHLTTTYDPNKINEGKRTSITGPNTGARDAMREAAKQGVNEGGGPLGIPRAARIAASGIVAGTDQLVMGAANTLPLTVNTLSEAFNRMYDTATSKRVIAPEKLTEKISAAPARIAGKMGVFNDPIMADAKAMNPQSDVAAKKWDDLKGFDETVDTSSCAALHMGSCRSSYPLPRAHDEACLESVSAMSGASAVDPGAAMWQVQAMRALSSSDRHWRRWEKSSNVTGERVRAGELGMTL
jgi:hypothetical protein